VSQIFIRLAKDSDATIWNDYVLGHPDSGPYHLWEWRQTIRDAYNHSPYYLIAEESSTNKVIGLLPLFYIKPPFVKGQLVSLPFCDYGGPLAETTDIKALLCQGAKNFASEKNATIELRCNQPLSAVSSLTSFGDKVRMILPLPESSDLLLKQFKSKLRSQIRRPVRDELYARIGRSELVGDFYTVFTVNMRDLGSPVHSQRCFEALMHHFAEKAKVGVVYKEHTPVAAGIILLHNTTVSIPWASSLRSFNRYSPNMLLYWSFLEYAADSGYKRFDFGRSSPDSGTFRFKKQWGAKPEPVFWYADSPPAITASGKGKKLRERAENIWMKLPLAAVNYLGPKIRKYISL